MTLHTIFSKYVLTETSPSTDINETTELIQYVSFSVTAKGPYVSVYYHSSY